MVRIWRWRSEGNRTLQLPYDTETSTHGRFNQHYDIDVGHNADRFSKEVHSLLMIRCPKSWVWLLLAFYAKSHPSMIHSGDKWIYIAAGGVFRAVCLVFGNEFLNPLRVVKTHEIKGLPPSCKHCFTNLHRKVVYTIFEHQYLFTYQDEQFQFWIL